MLEFSVNSAGEGVNNAVDGVEDAEGDAAELEVISKVVADDPQSLDDAAMVEIVGVTAEMYIKFIR